VLHLGSGGRVGRDVGGEPIGERLDLGQGGGQLLSRSAVLRLEPGQWLAGRLLELGPEGLEPVAQEEVRDDVVAVVALDPPEGLLVVAVLAAGLEPGLEGDDRRAGVAEGHLALEPVEGLEALDREALDRGATPWRTARNRSTRTSPRMSRSTSSSLVP
jgi:hypothetical protein